MASLFSVIVDVARNLEAMNEGTLTSGAASSMTDSFLPMLGWAADDFAGGTAYILHASGSAAEAQSRLVTSYTAGGTFSVSPNWTTAPAAGDIYGATTSRYPRSIMVSKINEALHSLGHIPSENTSGSGSGVRNYAYADDVLYDVRQVYTSTDTPPDWKLSTRAQVDRAAGEIVFHEAIDIGTSIRVVYIARHPDVWADSDVINGFVSPEWLALAAALACARWRYQQAGMGGELGQMQAQLINDLATREAITRRRNVRPIPPLLSTFPVAATAASSR